ncbi:uncharacterized protein TRUGW13939_06841 [Talaromyces rugulosus]|uniref:GH16 domain-containing protein n=1 Tax=Talaromyces rugulosus TaxID=121627 RepID=A0A7H8R257_TALRU|nr:uncharacterized protein TRUGW13939_06841 [Talaromyces rugulosus]QKX59701.1 hypothetical protein TRUGW13939_06841 [Talaromyces rugulosus]
MRTNAVFPLLYSTGVAGLNLAWDIDSSNFLDKFDFFTDADPTNGFVKYVDQSTASSASLFNTSNNQIYLGVDHTTTLSTSDAGRNSVRVTSKDTFSSGILITDFEHMPTAACGIWPAYWTLNNNGNPYGEIDIIESYNDVGYAYLSLHTSNACTMTGSDFTGTNPRTDCSLSGNTGCGVQGTDAQFGEDFNSAGGGVYVLSLQDSLKVWVFQRSDIPADITSGSPDPSGWGQPLLDLESTSGCDIASNFIDQSVIFNIDFCGANGAGGQEWTDWTDCSTKTETSTCNAYVAANPSVYEETYFSINSIKLYQ